MNNIQINQSSTTSSAVIEPKSSETSVVIEQKAVNSKDYENFQMISRDDSRFYITRSVKVEKVTFSLK